MEPKDSRNELIWVRDEKDVWVIAKRVKNLGREVVVLDRHNVTKQVPTRNCLPYDPAHYQEWDDVFKMPSLNEAALLNVLSRRWTEDNIYTFIGDVLVSVNPYHTVAGLYKMPESRDKLDTSSTAKPHLFVVADRAYERMITGFKNTASQSILINGESGAGKTEAAKNVMAYLTDVSQAKRKDLGNRAGRVLSQRMKGFLKPNLFKGRRGSGVKKQKPPTGERVVSAIETSILKANVVLEGFGNAKTMTNDNSSRFGKFVQLEFDSQGVINRAATLHFLLEKSRVVSFPAGGRNYHFFYQLCAAFQDNHDDLEEFRDLGFQLLPANKYHYLNANVPAADQERLQEQLRLREERDLMEQEKARRAAEAAAAELTKPAGGQLEACNNYRLDMQGTSYGDCVCGASRHLHEKGAIKDPRQQDLARQEQEKLEQERKDALRRKQLAEKNSQACDNYRVDVSGNSYGDCVCGFNRQAHLFKQKRNTLNLTQHIKPGQHLPGSPPASPTGGDGNNTGGACNQYRLDLTNGGFGDCVCGKPRSAHEFTFEPQSGKTKAKGLVSAKKQATLRRRAAPSLDSVQTAFDSSMFNKTTEAMDAIMIESEERTAVYRLLAAVLELGNISFIPKKAGSKSPPGSQVDQSDPTSSRSLTVCAQLFEVEPDQLARALCSRTLRAGKRLSKTLVPLNVAQAYEARDGLAKTLYSSLFEWVIQRTNVATKITVGKNGRNSLSDVGKSKPFIGILDIFGFEVLRENSFEQLCINFANEVLQSTFDSHWERLEKQEFEREGISHAKVDFRNNIELIQLLDAPPNGIFPLLDEQVLLGANATDEAFLAKVNLKHNEENSNGLYTGKRFAGDNAFVIAHYAGKVQYEVAGMVEKNINAVQPDLELVIARGTGNSAEFIRTIFAARDSQNSAAPAAPAPADTPTNTVLSRVTRRKPSSGVSGDDVVQNKMANVGTVSGKLRDQMRDLHDLLLSTGMNFIRCVNPNSNKAPDFMDRSMVVDQLRMLGALEMIRVRQEGFPERIPFEQFVERLQALAPEDVRGARAQAAAILNEYIGIDAKGTKWQMGESKCFLRAGIMNELELAQDVVREKILLEV